jgi:4-hydroxybenzoate polyprenyltransferase
MGYVETVTGIVREMRPWQWYKQSIVFLALVFSTNLTQPEFVVPTLITAAAFSLVAGANYIVNDILDREEDRRHPTKSERPIASGMVSVRLGASTAFLAFAAGFALAFYVNIYVLLVILFYWIQNMFYSYWLKQVIFVDVIMISVGFVLRAIAGAAAISVPISPWLIVCTLLAALLLAIGKRKSENNFSDGETRGVLNQYTDQVLDQMLVMVASALIISYSLYTFFGASNYLMVTLPFSYYAVFRFWHLVEQGHGEDPFKILKDKGFAINLALWTVIILLVLYVDVESGLQVIENYL